MRICLDASVAVAAHRVHEPSHAVARARVERVLAGTDPIIVPAIFSVEVASALTRGGFEAKVVTAYVEALLGFADVVTVGPKRAPRIMDVAIRTKLRAADATYAWVANKARVPLVTLDAEVLERAAVVCNAEPP
jgi:predicted nucleic acid-binding protein